MHKIVFIFKSKVFKGLIALALLTASVIIAIALLLGREAGSFVIRVSEDNIDKSIRVSTDSDPNNEAYYTTKLNAPGITGFVDYTPGLFLFEGYSELNKMQEVMGYQPVEDQEGHTALYVYTFNVINTSATNVGVSAKMTFSKVTNGLDKVIRVMTYAKTIDTEDPIIYYKPDEVQQTYDDYFLTPKAFTNDNTIFDDQTYRLSTSEGSNFMKYSIFFWIEGQDNDETTAIMGGTINFALEFNVTS